MTMAAVPLARRSVAFSRLALSRSRLTMAAYSSSTVLAAAGVASASARTAQSARSEIERREDISLLLARDAQRVVLFLVGVPDSDAVDVGLEEEAERPDQRRVGRERVELRQLERVGDGGVERVEAGVDAG